ncbi:hypothetical protein DSO57_1015500 [Entomophthora muscae]|uniref:Uncharacterized protein n=1 Tax=Entomophthora muscae TaxID=34485 RepID=A0ACC2UEZ3_9FUNG|nr:hypothetical protein DSO57_1015500 [Entomophthora muscae]
MILAPLKQDLVGGGMQGMLKQVLDRGKAASPHRAWTWAKLHTAHAKGIPLV